MYEWIGAITGNRKALQTMASWSRLIPRPVILLLCRCVGIMLFVAAGKGLRDNILRNMMDMLPDRSRKEIASCRFQFYQNLVITLYEIIIDSHRLSGSEDWRFRVDGEAHLEEALRLGRGAIVYTPHEGNFFYYYWYLCQKYPSLTIATAGSPELRPLYFHFRDMGCDGLDYDSTPPLELVRKLRQHIAANGVVFILGDFYRESFPISRFFGRVTRTPEGAALLAIGDEVPVIPFYGRREKGFVHRLTFEQPLHLYASYQKTQRREATKLLNRFMEQVIRSYPAQWFYWFNAEERWQEDPTAHNSNGNYPGNTQSRTEGKQASHSA